MFLNPIMIFIRLTEFCLENVIFDALDNPSLIKLSSK